MDHYKIYQRLAFFKILLVLYILIGQTNIFAQKVSEFQGVKINGVSLRGPYNPSYDFRKLEKVKKSNAQWIAFIPEATLDRTSLTLIPDEENDFWSETINANIQGIQIAKQIGFKVLLKPHIILGEIPSKANKQHLSHGSLASTVKIKPLKDKTRGAEWRGLLNLKTENDWKTFEKSYEDYIIKLAYVADSLNVDIFCIGTELKKSTHKRQKFWKNLIVKVRSIYKGPITYSANWDEYKTFPLWEELDFISVNTYFPISIKKTPRVRKTIRGWKNTKKELKKFSLKMNRKILFTEFGYRNVDFAGRRPWTHDRQDNKHSNLQAQTNLYKAFFKSFWKEPWVAGGFCWQWFHKDPKANNTTFSIQDKPALEVLKNWYHPLNQSPLQSN